MSVSGPSVPTSPTSSLTVGDFDINHQHAQLTMESLRSFEHVLAGLTLTGPTEPPTNNNAKVAEHYKHLAIQQQLREKVALDTTARTARDQRSPGLEFLQSTGAREQFSGSPRVRSASQVRATNDTELHNSEEDSSSDEDVSSSKRSIDNNSADDEPPDAPDGGATSAQQVSMPVRVRTLVAEPSREAAERSTRSGSSAASRTAIFGSKPGESLQGHVATIAIADTRHSIPETKGKGKGKQREKPPPMATEVSKETIAPLQVQPHSLSPSKTKANTKLDASHTPRGSVAATETKRGSNVDSKGGNGAKKTTPRK